MTPLARLLASYGEYHRDHRNVATHALGIPLIVLAVMVLLARPALALGEGWVFTPAIIGSVLAALWYVRLDLKVGLLMAALLALLCAAGHWIAQVSTAVWLVGGIGLFVVGWALQFLGHHYEGRKPAFFDDLKSLLVGPLFVVCEGLFALGLMPNLRRQVHAG